MESTSKPTSVKLLKIITVLIAILIALQAFNGIYMFYANKSCATDSLRAMGLMAGDKVVFLSNGGSGDAEKGRAYEAYHQLCLNKQFGI